MDYFDKHTPPAGPPAGLAASRDAEALERCRLSHTLLKAGDYERAVEALGGLWRGPRERPATEALSARAAAELLAQAGRLTSALGGARRIEGAQEAAKNLLSEAAGSFERLGDVRKVAEARSDLGLCYWREGANEEARVVLRAALDAFPSDGARAREDCELKGLVLVRLVIVEIAAGRHDVALALLEEAAPLVEASGSELLRGRFHSERAIALCGLAGAGGDDSDALDRALVEYAAASYHFEQAGHTRCHASNENNLALLFNSIGRHEEAHEHLARARALHAALGNHLSVAQCDDTLARVLITEGRFEEAEGASASAVRVFEDGDRQAYLAEALTTLGVAQARGGRYEEARRNLRRAAETAEAAGDRAGAGLAALALAEELWARLSPGELASAFARAHDLLSDTRDPATRARLAACARLAVGSASDGRACVGPAAGALAAGGAADGLSPEERWKGFSLKAEMLRYEAELISRALRDADGVVSRAAKLLGFRHHQTFVALLNNRHKELLGARTPIIPRRRSIIRPPEQRGN
ncbi:MAG TPA: tetratricopeptide repeat protein [Pyrinomonadaceae bacterium]